MWDIIGLGFFILLGLYILFKFAQSIRIVPAQEVYIVESWGKYSRNLYSGFHPLVPFKDQVAYKLTLKEEAIDVPQQVCITKDNVQIAVDGVVYMKVADPFKAAYNVNNYRVALIQLAQTAMRAQFGHLELDKTFEERDTINTSIVKAVDEAAEPWGINILRYEIQNITPPKTILVSMEKQMTADRDKRARIAQSEGEMTSRINRSQGMKQELINISEGEKQRKINAAEGHAAEIRSIAIATAEGIKKIASALQEKGGTEAMRLSLTQDYLKQLQGIANAKTSVILPLNLANLDETVQGLNSIVGDTKKNS